MKEFKMTYNHVDFDTWRISGGNAEHLAGLTGKAAYDKLENAKDAESARGALSHAVSEVMWRCEIADDIAAQWGLNYDGDACGGNGGYIDGGGDEYSAVHEHHGAGESVDDAEGEVEEMIAREMFADALRSGGHGLPRAAAWAGFIRDRESVKIYDRFAYGGYTYPGAAILEAARGAHMEYLDPQTIIALGDFLDSDEKSELIEVIKAERIRTQAAKALDVNPRYAMQRYRDRAAELVTARRDAHGWTVIASDTSGRHSSSTQCRTKADALREVSRRVIDIARQATKQFVMNGHTDID